MLLSNFQYLYPVGSRNYWTYLKNQQSFFNHHWKIIKCELFVKSWELYFLVTLSVIFKALWCLGSCILTLVKRERVRERRKPLFCAFFNYCKFPRSQINKILEFTEGNLRDIIILNDLIPSLIIISHCHYYHRQWFS